MTRFHARPQAVLCLALAAAFSQAYASDPASQDVTVPVTDTAPLVVEWTGTAPVGVTGTAAGSCPMVGGEGHEIKLTVPDGVYDHYSVNVDFHVEWDSSFSDPTGTGLVNLPDMILSLYQDGTNVGDSDGSNPEENVGLVNPPAGTYTAVICPYLATSATPYRGKLTVSLHGAAECRSEPTKALAAAPQSKLKPADTNTNEEFAGWPHFDLFRTQLTDKAMPLPASYQGRYQSSQYDRALGLPTFLWAEVGAKALAVGPLTEREQMIARAKAHLAHEAKKLKLTQAAIDAAEVIDAQYNGNGPAVVRFQQRVGGLSVFGRTLNVMLDRSGAPIAVSGYFAPNVDGTSVASLSFARSAASAIASAWTSLGGTLSAGDLTASKSSGDYQQFAAPVLSGTHFFERQPRVKKMLYATDAGLVPGYYVELFALARADRSRTAYSFIVSALDGHILRRSNLVAKAAAFNYRVFADAQNINQPYDEPVGNDYIPWIGTDPSGHMHPDGVDQNLVTLVSGPIKTGDPWLKDDATQTTGNHVDACIDSIDITGLPIAEPSIINNCIQGLELRAKTNGDHSFDYPVHAYDDPSTSNAKNAAIVSMFYLTNWLHDWWYNHGFDEVAGNAQTDNYGRGGADGDPLLAQGQDGSGRNNANMATPSDGSSPVMQQYLFDGPVTGTVEVTVPDGIGAIPFNVVSYGPKTFDYTGAAVVPDDGFDPGDDGCTGQSTPAVPLGLPIVGGVPSLAVPVPTPDLSMSGKIAIIVRGGGCPGSYKVRWALMSGASAVVLVHNEDGPPPPLVNGDLPIDLPVLGQPTDNVYQLPIVVISKADGQRIKDLITAGTAVTMHLKRDATTDLDGTLDNLIIAHEYFHYVHHRLTVADANQAGSMSEGWGDIDAFMLSARANDILVPGNDKWQGAYAGAPYVQGNYLFGIRRAPYSTDFARNAFTFKHIQEGEPTPNGGDGTGNSEVHNSGEIWANMMWNCYAGLLNDPRHSFEDARSRMQDYIIAGFKMTPADATYTEARDAVLSAVLASDFQDYKECSHGFAVRGAGLNAISPPRDSVDNVGVTEDYTEFVCPATVGSGTPSSPVVTVARAHSRFGGAFGPSLLLGLLALAGLRRRRMH